MTTDPRNDRIVEEHRVPVVEERVDVAKLERDGKKVSVRSRTIEDTARVSELLRDETVEVARVPVERIVDADPGITQDGDTIVVPVVEERLVVIKQLVVTEEIRLTRSVETREHAEDVVLRRNEVTIDET